MFCWRAVDFSTEIERRFFDADSIDADASIDRGARKTSKFTLRCNMFNQRNRRIAVFGDKAIICWRAVDLNFLLNRKSFFQCRFDRCRCLDRSKCSKSIENFPALPYVCMKKPMHRGFRGFSFHSKSLYCVCAGACCWTGRWQPA